RGAQRERARGTGICGTRGGAVRDRLCDRCASLGAGGSGPRAARWQPSADPLSARAPEGVDQPRCGALPALPARRGGAGDLPALRLPAAVMLTPAEWGIVMLSLRVGGVAVLACLPVAFALAWLLARGRFPGKLLLDGL